MQNQHISAAAAIPLLFVVALSVACWAGLGAVLTGLVQTWNGF